MIELKLSLAYFYIIIFRLKKSIIELSLGHVTLLLGFSKITFNDLEHEWSWFFDRHLPYGQIFKVKSQTSYPWCKRWAHLLNLKFCQWCKRR